MKLLLLLLAGPIISFGQNVNIPDANFKAYLINNTAINSNGDKKIQVSEASAFNGNIDCHKMNISNLKGIEAFTALTQLSCYENQLTSLDVTNNTALTELSCYDNQLTSLNVTKNTALEDLSCYKNKLTSLDVSKNTVLINLSCYSNKLTSLDVSKNNDLFDLSCYYNKLTSLDVSKNTALTYLRCFGNSFDCDALKRKYGIVIENKGL
jgi:hypothetical protein